MQCKTDLLADLWAKTDFLSDKTLKDWRGLSIIEWVDGLGEWVAGLMLCALGV